MKIIELDNVSNLPGEFFKMCTKESEIPDNVEIAYRIKGKNIYYRDERIDDKT